LWQVSRGAEHLDDLDLNSLLTQADDGKVARYCTIEGRNEVPETLDAQMIKDAAPLFDDGEKMQLQYNVQNTMRAIGTKLSSRITRQFGMTGLRPGHITVRLRGAAGQSLGAFAVQAVSDNHSRANPPALSFATTLEFILSPLTRWIKVSQMAAICRAAAAASLLHCAQSICRIDSLWPV